MLAVVIVAEDRVSLVAAAGRLVPHPRILDPQRPRPTAQPTPCRPGRANGFCRMSRGDPWPRALGSAVALAGLLKVPFVFNVPIVLVAFLFSAAVGVIFGYVPAARRRASTPSKRCVTNRRLPSGGQRAQELRRAQDGDAAAFAQWQQMLLVATDENSLVIRIQTRQNSSAMAAGLCFRHFIWMPQDKPISAN